MAEVIEGVVLPLTDRTIDLIVDAMSAEQMAAALKVALKERRDVESRPPDVTVTMLEAPRPGERVQLVIRAERGPLGDRWLATDRRGYPVIIRDDVVNYYWVEEAADGDYVGPNAGGETTPGDTNNGKQD